MPQYWLRIDDRTYGPYEADEVRQYGTPETLVSSGGDWLPLAVHPDFRAAAGPSTLDGPAQREGLRPAVPPALGSEPRQFPQPASATQKRGCGCRTVLLTLLALPIVLAVLGAAGWGAYRLYLWRYPPFDPHVELPPYSWKPPASPHAGYVSPAIDVTPAPGLRVRADEGALDAPRQFTARRLTDTELQAARARLEGRSGPPLAGFDVSCGMGESDRFRRPVTMVFDLAALGIDSGLWRIAQVVMTDEQGRLIPMASILSGSEIRIETPHNGAVFVVLGFSTIGGLVKFGLTGPDLAKELEGKEWVGVTSSRGRFHVLWQVTDHHPDATAEALRKELEAAWKDFAFGTSVPQVASGVPSRWPSLAAYKAHLQARIADMERTAGNRDWLLAHWAHPAAPIVAALLESAFDYLSGVRHFSAPGAVVNIYLRNPWKGRPDEYGLAENLKTRRPFIGINMTRLPPIPHGSRYGDADTAELTLTTLHELFHVFGSQYYSVEWGRYTWLNEAAALTLEREAWEDYGAHFPSRADYDKALTLRDLHWGTYRQPLEADLDTDDDYIHHGYGVSFFVEHMRQNTTWARNPRAFLPALMYQTAAAGSGSGGLSSVSGISRDLAQHYREFVRANANDIANHPLNLPGEEHLFKGDSRIRIWRSAQVAPLSSQIYRLGLDSSVAHYEKARAVVYVEGLKESKVELRSQTSAARGWLDLTDKATVIDPLLQTTFRKAPAAAFSLQVIGAFAPSDLPPTRPTWHVVLLPPPDPPTLPQGPRASAEEAFERDGELKVEWRRSDLEGREHFYGYELRVTTLREGRAIGMKAKRYAYQARKPTLTRIGFEELVPEEAFEPEAEGSYVLKVTLAEVLDKDPAVVGPESAPAEMEILLGTTTGLKQYQGPGNMSGVKFTEKFSYYPARRKMPSSWTAGFTPPAHEVWNGNASSWRWVVEGWAGAHPDKVLHGTYEMFWQSGAAKGTVLCSAVFRYGVLNGPVAVYHQEGVIGGRGQYTNGKPDGEWPQYGFKGELIDTAVYNAGKFVERRQADR